MTWSRKLRKGAKTTLKILHHIARVEGFSDARDFLVFCTETDSMGSSEESTECYHWDVHCWKKINVGVNCTYNADWTYVTTISARGRLGDLSFMKDFIKG